MVDRSGHEQVRGGLDQDETSLSVPDQRVLELVRLCLTDPNLAARALGTLQEQGVPMADAATLPAMLINLRPIADSLSASALKTARNLIESDNISDGSDVLALAHRMGADAAEISAISGSLTKGMLGDMRKALTDGDEDTAFRLADTLTSLDPDLAEAWQVSGRMLMRQQRHDQALVALRRAVDLNPASQNTLLNLARAEIAAGDLKSGMLALFKLLRLAESDDGRYKPHAVAELEFFFAVISQRAGRAEVMNDPAALEVSFGMLNEIAQRISGGIVDYVAGAKNAARAATGFARIAQGLGRVRLALDACDAAIETDPENAGLWSTLARLRLQMHDNRLAAHAFRQSLDIEPQQPSLLDGLAEALFRDGDTSTAMETVRKAHEMAPENSQIAARLARIERFSALAGEASESEGQTRHIALLGLPNQGNARLGAMLGNLPDVAFVGESVWIGGHGEGSADERKYAACPTCRSADCSVIPLSLRKELTRDGEGWYRRIGDACGARVLVSSDNSPHIVRDQDPLLSCDAIVGFRAPQQSWLRLKQAYARARRAEPSVLQFLQTWCRTHMSILHDFPLRGVLHAVDLDAFDAQPDGQLSALCSRLDLPVAQAQADLSGQHYFGINPAEIADAATDATVHLSSEERQIIDSFTEAARIHEALKKHASS